MRKPVKPYKLSLLLALILAVAATGCRSHKNNVKTPPQGFEIVESGKPVTLTPAEIKKLSLPERYDQLCSTYNEWSDFSAPIKLELKAPARLSASGRAYMKRGEWIYISVRMLGFELATVWVDRDSVHAVEKVNKRFVSESLSKVFGSGKVTLTDVQDLLTGRAFLAGKGTATASMRKDFSFSENGNDSWLMIPKRQPSGASYGFLVNTGWNALSATQLEVGSHNASVLYNLPTATKANGTFMKEATVATSTPKGKNIEATITWDLGSAKWNTGETRTWKAPKGYTRISAAALLKTLGSL